MGALTDGHVRTSPRILFFDLERLAGKYEDYIFDPRDVGRRNYLHPDRWTLVPSKLPLLCGSWAWYGQRGTGFVAAWENRDDEFHVARKFAELIGSADVVCGFNQRAADMPWLQQQWTRGGIDIPRRRKQLDLYLIARKELKLESKSLRFLLDYLDLPNKSGKYDPAEAWAAYEGDEKAQRRLERYSRGDSRVLVSLAERLRQLYGTSVNLGLYYMDDDEHCPACGGTDLEPDGWVETGVTMYAAYRCRDPRCRATMQSKHRKHAVTVRGIVR